MHFLTLRPEIKELGQLVLDNKVTDKGLDFSIWHGTGFIEFENIDKLKISWREDRYIENIFRIKSKRFKSLKNAKAMHQLKNKLCTESK